MARRQRRFTVFSLSFLDIMSCGFGATVLVFILIHHSTLERSDEMNAELMIELESLDQQIEQARVFVNQAETEISDADDELVRLEASIRRMLDATAKARDELADQSETTLAQRESLASLMTDVRALEAEALRLEGAAEERELSQADARSFLGDGSRQYLTGLKLGGRNIVIMLDASASMLDTTLVNIIRRRNMPLERKLQGPKWQRSLQTVEWLLANLPETSDYQVYVFNETARPLLPGTNGEWFAATDKDKVTEVAVALRDIDPRGGTSLHNAFVALNDMKPIADNVILITDGLPTLGPEPTTRRTISARNRMRLFQRAIQELPFGVPINTILLPLEGDPMSSSLFWRLAMNTGGSFMSPSRDWP